MNKQQLSQVDMFRAVIALCVKYPNIVGIIPAFKAAAGKLGPNVAAIKAAELIENQTSKSVTGSKNELKDLLSSISTDVSAALFALATETGNADLLAKVNYSATDLNRMKQETLLTVATAMHDLAVDYKGDMDNYGISATVIGSIPGIVDNFSTAIPTPRIEDAARKAAAKTIKTLISETSGLLKSQMDKTARILRKDNVDFYGEYRTARKIVRPAVIHTSIRGSAFNGKKPVYKAWMEIAVLELMVYSNIDGVLDSGKIKNGIYDVRVGAPGLATQVFSNVEVKLGKAVKLDVALVSEVVEMTRVA